MRIPLEQCLENAKFRQELAQGRGDIDELLLRQNEVIMWLNAINEEMILGSDYLMKLCRRQAS